MSDLSNKNFHLPSEQQAIRDKCFHPSGTFVELPIEDVQTSIPERFEKIVRMFPDRITVEVANYSLTYDELNKAADRLRPAILAWGIMTTECRTLARKEKSRNSMRQKILEGLTLRLLLVCIWQLGAVTIIGDVQAAEVKSEMSQLRVSFVSATGSLAPLWIAKEKGFFNELGLNVDIIYARGLTSVQSMIAEETEFTYSGCTPIMTSRKAGSDLIIIATSGDRNIYAIAARPNIIKPEQLIGKKIAINDFGDTSHFAAQFALEKAGIDPNSVTYIRVGDTPSRLAALMSGSVEAALQSVDTVQVVRKLGMNILINLFEQGFPLCISGVGVSKSFMNSHPRTVEAFLRGLGKGNAFLREGNAEIVKAIMAKYMRTGVENKRLVNAYEFYAKQFNSRELKMDPEGIRFIIKQMALKDKSWLQWKPEQFYDDSIINDLNKQGFWETLYERIR